jgi:hypothetical protein
MTERLGHFLGLCTEAYSYKITLFKNLPLAKLQLRASSLILEVIMVAVLVVCQNTLAFCFFQSVSHGTSTIIDVIAFITLD